NNIDAGYMVYFRLLGALNSDSPKYLKTLSAWADLNHRLRQYDNARSAYEFAFKERQKTLGEENPETLDSMEGLVRTLFDLKDFQRAEPLAIRLLDIRERQSGPIARKTFRAAHLLGDLYFARQQVQLAEQFYKKVDVQSQDWA